MMLSPVRSNCFAWVTLAAFVLAVPAIALAQDYEIKVTRPAKVGEVYRLTTTCQDEREMVVNFTGKPAQNQKDKKVVNLVGDIKVLEVTPSGQEIRIECTVVECTVATPDGKSTPVVAPQTKVIAFSEGAERRLTDAAGKPLAPAEAQLLTLVLQTDDPQAPSDEETFGAEGRKKVGDSWPSNPEKLRAGAARQKLQLLNDGLSGSTKLVEVKKVGGQDCLVLEAKINGKLEPGMSLPGLPPALKLKAGSIDGVMGKVSPVNTALPTRSISQTMNMILQFAGNAPDGSGPVELQMKSKRTLERTRDVQ